MVVVKHLHNNITGNILSKIYFLSNMHIYNIYITLPY